MFAKIDWGAFPIAAQEDEVQAKHGGLIEWRRQMLEFGAAEVVGICKAGC